jgi:uncharacterized membrane protein (UPF0127 family)
MPLPRRLRRLPRTCFSAPQVADCDVRCARDWLARLLGLAGLQTLPPAVGLLLPGTRSVHTCGMRFALDLVWLDGEGHVVRVDRDVRPWRVRSCRGAWAVVELPSRVDP